MGTFGLLQHQKREQTAAPTPSFARPSRSFTPVSSPATESRPQEVSIGPEQARRFDYSFDQIPVFSPARKNTTGLPDTLKAGVEQLSGKSMDDVRVHYNSSKPAEVQALAYTQGTEIHVAPDQEKHLAHEAWHVVQQMQGRVKPTLQAKGVAINDDEGLEREADEMGERARMVGATEVQRMKVNDSETAEENFSSTLFTPRQSFSVAKVVQEKARMKARKGQKKELKACLEMLREARDARGNVNADEDEIRQHDQALRSGQHHNVRQVTLNQLIGDIQDKQNELTDLNLRDSDALGKSQGPEAIQLKDNG